MSHSKTLLILGLFACFFMTGDSLYKFLYNHIPLTRENKCLSVLIYGKDKYKALVVKNHPVAGQCEIIVEFKAYGSTYYMPTSASYENLRDLDAKEIGCD